MSTLFCPVSFEFFPPRTSEAEGVLRQSLAELLLLRPEFVSITYGAGGSTRDRTCSLVTEVQAGGQVPAMPHLTCVGQSYGEMQHLLETYAAAGVTRILALRGDKPAGASQTQGDFTQAADLIRFIRRFNDSGQHPYKGGFQVAAACFPEGHPGTPNRMTEMDHLKAKVDAGVDFLISQAFFDNALFHDFRERCALAGVHVPLLAGLLPLPSAHTQRRMAELAGNMRYPARLLRALQRVGEEPYAFQAVATHHTAQQCHDLLDHEVDGLHFYTLNQPTMTREVLRRVGWQI